MTLAFLPECLTDDSTSGSLVTQLDEKTAILSLNYPAGTKALLYWDSLWLSSQDVTGISGWEELVGTEIKVNARRVEGYEEFDYQV